MSATRKETPSQTPGSATLHFDARSSPLLPACVHEALHRHVNSDSKVEVAPALAALLNASAIDDVEVVSSNLGAVVQAVAFSLALRRGDVLVVPEDMLTSPLLRGGCLRAGVTLAAVPVLAGGQPDGSALRTLMIGTGSATRLVVLPLVPGDAAGAALAGARDIVRNFSPDAVVLVDASDCLGLVPVDVNTLNADIVWAAGDRFLRGPRGAAVLHTRHDSALFGVVPPLAVPSLAVALAAAATYAAQLGLDSIHHDIAKLAEHLRALLAADPGVVVAPASVSPALAVLFRATHPSAGSCNELRAQLAAANMRVSGPHTLPGDAHQYLGVFLHVCHARGDLERLARELLRLGQRPDDNDADLDDADFDDWIDVAADHHYYRATIPRKTVTREPSKPGPHAAPSQKMAPFDPAHFPLNAFLQRSQPQRVPGTAAVDAPTNPAVSPVLFSDGDDSGRGQSDASSGDELDFNSVGLFFQKTGLGLVMLDNTSPPNVDARGFFLNRRAPPPGARFFAPPAAPMGIPGTPNIAGRKAAPVLASAVPPQIALSAHRVRQELPPWM